MSNKALYTILADARAKCEPGGVIENLLDQIDRSLRLHKKPRVEATVTGVRVCWGNHHPDAQCKWENFVPEVKK